MLYLLLWYFAKRHSCALVKVANLQSLVGQMYLYFLSVDLYTQINKLKQYMKLWRCWSRAGFQILFKCLLDILQISLDSYLLSTSLYLSSIQARLMLGIKVYSALGFLDKKIIYRFMFLNFETPTIALFKGWSLQIVLSKRENFWL